MTEHYFTELFCVHRMCVCMCVLHDNPLSHITLPSHQCQPFCVMFLVSDRSPLSLRLSPSFHSFHSLFPSPFLPSSIMVIMIYSRSLIGITTDTSRCTVKVQDATLPSKHFSCRCITNNTYNISITVMISYICFCLICKTDCHVFISK